jgi:hypothetical protein
MILRLTFCVAMWAAAALFVPSEASAQVPRPNVYDGGNRWLITDFLDSSPNHVQLATQEICFLPYAVVGTSIQGVWFSTSYPDWNGRYYQEGDELKMTGDFWRDTGHDHMTLVHTTVDVAGQIRGMAFKDWTEWVEDGRFGQIVVWANARMVRAGRCGFGPVPFPLRVTAEDLVKLEEEAPRVSVLVPERLSLSGKAAAMPSDADLEDIDTYFERTGQVKNRK